MLLQLKSSVLLYIGGAALGFFIMSIFAIAPPFACEVSFPVSPNALVGVMLAVSQVLSTAQIVAASFIFGQNDKPSTQPKFRALIVVIILVVCLELAVATSVFSLEDLRKTKMDKKESNKKDGFE